MCKVRWQFNSCQIHHFLAYNSHNHPPACRGGSVQQRLSAAAALQPLANAAGATDKLYLLAMLNLLRSLSLGSGAVIIGLCAVLFAALWVPIRAPAIRWFLLLVTPYVLGSIWVFCGSRAKYVPLLGGKNLVLQTMSLCGILANSIHMRPSDRFHRNRII